MLPVIDSVAQNAEVAWNDTQLIRQCLSGSKEAWSLLIEKYKALIYSVPVKCGLPPREAAEVFQATCVELLARLPEMREPRALPKWLIQVIELLFLETPPRPYNEVAGELGLAVASIGFTHQKCIERLRWKLSELGFD